MRTVSGERPELAVANGNDRRAGRARAGRTDVPGAGRAVRHAVALLDPDVTVVSDGGGALNAARRPVQGADERRELVTVTSSTTRAARIVRVDAVLAPHELAGAARVTPDLSEPKPGV
ncbi:hypothetical protein ACXR2U_01335 [Jatrophihabitans sp. YIM 134969]